jgi:hypothetical protein
MQTLVKSFGILLATIIVAGFVSSCKKIETSNNKLENDTATIRGVAEAQLDLTNDTLLVPVLEPIPSGTRIRARLASDDLLEFPSAGANYGTIQMETEVDSDGEFEFQVPANLNPVTVMFEADDFMTDQIQADTTEEEKVFELVGGAFTEMVTAGALKYVELTFTEK